MAVKPRLLWVGDACVPTGFARVTHNIVASLTEWWDVSVLGLNYRGDPHPYSYDIYPASVGGDIYGFDRIEHICRAVRPDLILINNDPWIVPMYVKTLRKAKIDTPVVAYMPVDGKNVRGYFLNKIDCAIMYTDFGADEMRSGGYTGRLAVVPHGVDVDLYRPLPQWVCRDMIGLHKSPNFPAGSFVVGNVNRNQPRKRLDLSVQLFARWWNEAGKPANAFLYLHCKSKADRGWDLEQLSKYYGVNSQLIITARDMTSWTGVGEDKMPLIYNTFDVQITTTQGEGWGLTTQEGMACGIPQVVPKWSALGEWVTSGAYRVECSTFPVTPNDVNAIGGLPDSDLFVSALHRAYANADERRKLGQAARELTCDQQYRWSSIAYRFHCIFSEVLREVSQSADDQSGGSQQPATANEGVSA